jgi:mono/diheme cytochrome c family protein/plastocyanin
MNAERGARLLVLFVVVGLPLSALAAHWAWPQATHYRTVEIHGRMPQQGGWAPGDFSVAVGDTVQLRLTSDDVMHSFAIGRMELSPVDVKPGEVTELTLSFTDPGKYVYYCTRWCGVEHWRMRGTIDVIGGASADSGESPLYMSLGLDLDAPHLADAIPERRPSAARGASLDVTVPDRYLSVDYHRRHSPADTWRSLRGERVTRDLTDLEVWDLLALVWQLNTTPIALESGKQLYAVNCAACHGETGAGDGVMAPALASDSLAGFGHAPTTPADFTDVERMLGASPALLHGKIVRGGMGTGMPYWGPVLTDSQAWAVVSYLWTFQFRRGEER